MALTKLCRPSALSSTKPGGVATNFVDGAGTGPTNIDPGDPISHDETTSYREATQPLRGDIWYCATGKPHVGVVFASTANIRFRGQSGLTPTYYCGMYSAETIIGSAASQIATGDFANLSRSETPSISQVEAATFGVGWYTDNTNPTDSRITSAWISLVYDPPGGNFLPIWSLVGMLLGGQIGLEHMPQLARMLWRSHELGLPPEDYAAALRSLQEWTRPRFVFLGA